MNSTKRKPMRRCKITLYSEENGTKREFEIGDSVNENGGSSLCYNNVLWHNGHGVLKEFYPNDAETAAVIRRGKNNLLQFTETDTVFAEKFRKKEEKYREPYDRLIEEKGKPENKNMNLYTPNFEIYRDSKNKKSSTTSYLWTDQPEVESFERICLRLHDKNHRSRYWKDAADALTCIMEIIHILTEDICDLHTKGFIHRDIKPSNFGFKKDIKGRPIYRDLLIFDLNSICIVDDDEDEQLIDLIYSEGYGDPDDKAAPDPKTDIFSIGATLFNAVVITPESARNAFRYKKEYFSELDRMVRESELIAELAFLGQKQEQLAEQIVKILKNSLNIRKKRYDSCEEMLADIETAEKLLNEIKEHKLIPVQEPTKVPPFVENEEELIPEKHDKIKKGTGKREHTIITNSFGIIT